MEDKNKDICGKCIHLWSDFPLPLEESISHCEIVDERIGFKPIDEIVPYPCVECPFNSFKNK